MARIIVADDNPALANVVRFHLERAKHQVVVVNNGAAALEELRKSEFDLIVTDQQMPKMTGLEVCAAVRSEWPDSAIPIILLTAKRLELDVEAIQQQYGVTRVFPKPFSPSEVVSVVQEALVCSHVGDGDA